MITVIVCTYNRAALLSKTLETLSMQSLPKEKSVELILVDNNSTDSTKAVFEEWQSKIPFKSRYIFESSQGRSYSLNKGIEEAQGELILFTDDDVIVDRNWICAMHQASQTYPSAVGFGGKVVPIWPDKIPSWLLIKGTHRLKVITPETDMGESDREFSIKEAPTGCNSAFRRCVFEEGYRFRTDLGYIGSLVLAGEDTEFGFNLLQKGYMLMYIADAVVNHPAIPERITKSYARSRYFNLGRGCVRAFDDSKYANLPRIFGIYRYLIRDSLELALWWIGYLCLGQWGTSFYYEVKLLTNLGMVYELWKNGKENDKKEEIAHAYRV